MPFVRRKASKSFRPLLKVGVRCSVFFCPLGLSVVGFGG